LPSAVASLATSTRTSLRCSAWPPATASSMSSGVRGSVTITVTGARTKPSAKQGSDDGQEPRDQDARDQGHRGIRPCELKRSRRAQLRLQPRTRTEPHEGAAVQYDGQAVPSFDHAYRGAPWIRLVSNIRWSWSGCTTRTS